MNLYIKQRLFSFKNKFDVYSENEVPIYYVEGKLFSLSLELTIYDIQTNEEVAFIRRELFRLLPHFVISRPGYENIYFKKEFTFFKPSYEVLGCSWRLQGDFLAHDYQIVDSDGSLVMVMSKHWFTWADTYELSISNPQDAILALCLTLCVDAVLSDDAGAASV